MEKYIVELYDENAGNYEQETAIMLINAFKSAKIINGSEDE